MDKLSASNWRKLWASRTPDSSVLDDDALLRLAGYDSPFCRCTALDYADHVAEIAQFMGIERGASILDIGCGPGLFYKHIRVPLSLYCGIDYSHSLLKIGKAILPAGVFINLEASSIDAIQYGFDHIIANSVFQYFSSYYYALSVVTKSFSLLKPGGSMAILDLNDADRIAMYHNIRSELFGGLDQYTTRYSGLSHMFYLRDRLAGDCGKLGFQKIRVRDQNIHGYANSAYRFNLYLKK